MFSLSSKTAYNTCVTSGFCQGVDENCAVLCYHAASRGNLLETFRDMSSPSSRGNQGSKRPLKIRTKVLPETSVRTCHCHKRRLKMRPIGCPETSIRICHFSLRNNPKDHSSLIYNLCSGFNYLVSILTGSLMLRCETNHTTKAAKEHCKIVLPVTAAQLLKLSHSNF
jgi:hypothetical protein